MANIPAALIYGCSEGKVRVANALFGFPWARQDHISHFWYLQTQKFASEVAFYPHTLRMLFKLL